MALGDVDHLFNGFEITPFFRQRLPHLEVIDRICKLSDDPENMLLNEVA